MDRPDDPEAVFFVLATRQDKKMTAHPSGKRHALWSLDDIPFHEIDHDAVHDDEHLFFTLASASFIEITSDLYTENLIEFFRDDGEAVDWLDISGSRRTTRSVSPSRHMFAVSLLPLAAT